MDIEERISLIKRAVAASLQAGAAGARPVIEEVERVKAASEGMPNELDSDIEVAFKDLLFEAVKKALSESASLTDEQQVGIRGLMDLALAVCLEGNVGKKVPCLLLEDYFEVLPVDQVDMMWLEVEAREDTIHKLFESWDNERAKATGAAGGKQQQPQKSGPTTNANPIRLVMLKACNALLRKLSKVQNTGVCGRIMLYLARNWALSDQSAINKRGDINTSNTTAFESEQEFNANHKRGEQATSSLSPASLGKRKFEEEAEGEIQKVLQQQQQSSAAPTEAEQEGELLEYSLYETFWGLQGHLVDPRQLLDAQAAKWSKFVEDADKVLKAFDGMVVSEEAAQQLLEESRGRRKKSGNDKVSQTKKDGESNASSGDKKRRRTIKGGEAGAAASSRASSIGGGVGAQDDDEDDDDEGSYIGCKYLTNSRLFRLQLRDPLIRVQVLTQIMIVLNYVALIGGGGTRLGWSELHKHCRRLIKSTPPLGADYLAMLDTTLAREEQWLRWKQDGCKTEIEKELAHKAPSKYCQEDEAYKAALGRFKSSHAFRALDGAQKLSTRLKDVPFAPVMDLAKVEAKVSQTNYSWDKVKEDVDYADAHPEDYEGDDDSYRPRKNSIFAWRSLRLVPGSHPEVLTKLETGDFNHVWRKIYGGGPSEEEESNKGDKKRKHRTQQEEEEDEAVVEDSSSHVKSEEEATPMDVDNSTTAATAE